ncbi:MAG: hypothetical protein KJ941_00890 [Bacteroidetes bacterium]|nr:hypothetical protein [Bacteroidota bacterium]
MLKKITLVLILLIGNYSFSQTFKSVNELINISKKDPSALEKELSVKGFSFIGKDKERQEFSKFGEKVSYELNPRVFQYSFRDRTSYLNYYSQMEKSGFTITKGKVTKLENDQDENANIFEKGKVQISLIDISENNEEEYSILIYPFYNESATRTSSANNNSSKESISYGNVYVAVMLPKSKMGDPASKSTTIKQDMQGQGGMGATAGFEGGWSGVAGFNSLNSKLPFFLNFGLSLKLMGGIQPFSYENLGKPYDDYKYNGFAKMGGGGGPAIVLSPFRDADFRLTFYYDFLPSANFGGSIVYDGPDANYSQTIERDDASFALIKVFGFSLKYESILFGVETSKYTDQASYTNNYGYVGNMGSDKFKAKLPINQLIFKFGFCW